MGQHADRTFIELRQGEKRFPAKLLELHGHDNDDLALLEVSPEHAGVPIPLGNEVWLDDRLVLSGYPSYAIEGQAFDTLLATYEFIH